MTKGMKTILLCLSFAVAAQLLAGQVNYETVLRAVSLSERGEADEAADLLASTGDQTYSADFLIVRGDIFIKASRIREAEERLYGC